MSIFIVFAGEDSDSVDSIAVCSTLQLAQDDLNEFMNDEEDGYGFIEEWTLDGDHVGNHGED